MPSLATITILFKEIWNDLKQESMVNISTFFYFLVFLVVIILVLSFTYYPRI